MNFASRRGARRKARRGLGVSPWEFVTVLVILALLALAVVLSVRGISRASARSVPEVSAGVVVVVEFVRSADQQDSRSAAA